MNLHHDSLLFSQTLRAASQHLKINIGFVEKDYWITLLLRRLSGSKYSDEAIFKGGTSLSKGYRLIDRFSEDVDLAIVNTTHKTGNEIKTIIRHLEKEITGELTEFQEEGITSKGSRYRKSLFRYPTIQKNDPNNRLIVEVNSFANPIPFQKRIIQSMVFDFLDQTYNQSFIDAYQLHPFEINILNKEQTLLEKLVSIIRFSLDRDPVPSVSSKIRHFYDLYFLAKDDDCMQCIQSDTFKQQFLTLLEHDKMMFDEPTGWTSRSIAESPLIRNFDSLWSKIKDQYQSELSALAYRPIPDENDVAQTFIRLSQRIV
ncbi:nucleotidyl transferase AbiEii/AbiGii toxin family protein [Dysgonomonadaceae bacterium zrk40]|nr:nucleotidyl transferase AbiEii/AbiGii toxin family protein [Dysgonomonadaceae bacterium zrk40]